MAAFVDSGLVEAPDSLSITMTHPPPLTRKDHLDSGTVDEAAMPARYPLLLGCAGFRVQMVGGTVSSCVQHQGYRLKSFQAPGKIHLLASTSKAFRRYPPLPSSASTEVYSNNQSNPSLRRRAACSRLSLTS
jgi:hypothetical protein